MLSQNKTPTERLQALLNGEGWVTLDDFKIRAMSLAEQGADLTINATAPSNGTVLHRLVIGNVDGKYNVAILRLLELGININLADVKDNDNLTALQWLLEYFEGQSPSIISLRDFKISAMLLANNRADMTVVTPGFDRRSTLLHQLIKTNMNDLNEPEIKDVLKLDAGLINVRDGFGRTPLQAQIRDDKNVTVEYVDKLVQLKSELQTIDNNGETLLHSASYSGNLMVAQHLKSKGLDLGAKTQLNETMLHVSYMHNNIKLWQWLYENNIDINAQNKLRRTALFYAVLYQNVDFVKWLIGKNVCLDLKDCYNETALAIAQELHFTEIAKLLIDANSKQKPVELSNNKESTQQSDNTNEHVNKQLEKKPVQQNEIQKETFTYLIDMVLKTPAETTENKHIIAACRKIYTEGHLLARKMMTDNASVELTVIEQCADIMALKKSLKLALKVLQPGVDENAINELKDHAKSLDGKPSFWKKFIGALLTLVGAVMIGLGISTVVPSGGLSIAACAGGSALMATGVTFFYSGRHKGISRGMSDLAEAVQKRKLG